MRNLDCGNEAEVRIQRQRRYFGQGSRDTRSKGFHQQQKSSLQHFHAQHLRDSFLRSLKLVVVMNAVETWKALQVSRGERTSEGDPRWLIVRIAENDRDFCYAALSEFISARASTGNPSDSQTMFTGK
jgi:hypothetical protein